MSKHAIGKNSIHKINLLIRLYFPRHNAMEQKNYIIHLPALSRSITEYFHKGI